MFQSGWRTIQQRPPAAAALYAVAVQSPELRSCHAAGAARAREPWSVATSTRRPIRNWRPFDLGELDLVRSPCRADGSRRSRNNCDSGGALRLAVLRAARRGRHARDGSTLLRGHHRARRPGPRPFHVDAAPVVKAGDEIKSAVAIDGGIDAPRLALPANEAPTKRRPPRRRAFRRRRRARERWRLRRGARAPRGAGAGDEARSVSVDCLRGRRRHRGWVVVSHAPVEASGSCGRTLRLPLAGRPRGPRAHASPAASSRLHHCDGPTSRRWASTSRGTPSLAYCKGRRPAAFPDLTYRRRARCAASTLWAAGTGRGA